MMTSQQDSHAQDAALVRRIQAGDAEAYADLVRKYHQQLLNFVFRLVGRRDLAEDIGQEVFLAVYKSLHRFDQARGVPFSAWLFIAARNRCVSELRRKHPWVGLDQINEPASGQGDGEERLLRQELGAAIEDSLDQLPEPFRTTILRSLAGDSIKEIAATERVPAGTVKSRLARARERMKALLSGGAGEQ